MNVNAKKVKTQCPKKTLFILFHLDKTVIDPVYETLRVAAETRKRTLADYIQQRQQSLNKQASFNSQGSSEADNQPSPRPTRHTDLISSSSYSQAASSSSSSGKRSQ